jgi:diadenosine tetraphosphate (Ap4A) HIT family hydrolase
MMSRAEYDDWIQTLPDETCTFCQWREYQVILKSTDNWMWILNRAPYWPYHTMLVPKRHVVQIHELSVIETGELFSVYSQVVEILVKHEAYIPEALRTGKYIFFWRYRDHQGEPSDQRKVEHFHMHIAPDRERMFDPLLDADAHTFDYITLANMASTYQIS